MIRGGKSLVSSSPAFSNDATKLLVCTGTTVSIFSTATALQIGELEGHLALVTSVIVEPAVTSSSKKLCFCWTASLDGTMRFWDFSVPELIKTVDVKLPIFSMVIPRFLRQQVQNDDKKSDLYAYVSVEDIEGRDNPNKSSSGQIRKCNLTKSHLIAALTLAETPTPELITISPSGKFFAICSKRKVFVWETSNKESDRTTLKKLKLHHTKNFTAVAFHESERIIAAGDYTGRILIWRGFGNKTFLGESVSAAGKMMIDKEGRPGVRGNDDAESCSTWHWHSSEVIVLSFSSDGAYLYSGGKEGVLVVWQLDTGKRKFLPRIGSPLLYYIKSSDPTMSSISCADNQIHLLQMPAMNILKSIAGIKLPFASPVTKEGSSGLYAFSSLGLLALRTENYCVQFYSLFDDRESLEVRVCERNHQPGDDVTVMVALIALSLDGTLMCTVEERLPENEIGGLICLKFWSRENQNEEFSLMTVIYEPHRDAGISAITFHPTLPMAVSSSFGGDFKTWVSRQKHNLKDKVHQRVSWTCHAVGSYKKKPMTAASFSPDGSVLAVAAETVITLWDPHKNVLVTVIGETSKYITTLSFTGKSKFIVSVSHGSSPQLCVWSLSKLSIAWSYKLRVEALTCAEDGSFAIFAILNETYKTVEGEIFLGRDGVILIFNPSDPYPVSAWSVTKAVGGSISFIKRNTDVLGDGAQDVHNPNELLAYVNGDHEYMLFDHNNTTLSLQPFNRSFNSGLKETAGQFGYNSIYGELPEFNPMKTDEAAPAPSIPTGKPWETIFSGSSHNLPSLVKLCPVYLESFLEKRSVPLE
uniref:WD repeat-containing protein 75 second beta-propeller domain-containing protein n=1 Tax=Kalanchoe fedtschenkoi TaxID=63787 RepID=A0A7N0VM13_KALFE